ncbi:GNAT family N-acetyltransferase [Nocardioides sp. TF02-7]|uniref:GNAT family N-acetyltransferase n=1 Tax=Nocardioides sp. TF02-7 TaxID=2917724 RepID=UPI001F06E769|nr:GNAT family N-acetyltransferase [Nocardioides sp. TF02-7]UMG93802.1 acetyltransferase [Nocardioides sp. TF02-7]
MQEVDRERVVTVYRWIDEQPHVAAYLVHHDDTPLALFQTYDPAVDEVGEHYDRREGDLGVHLLLASDPARAGRTPELLAFLLGHCFADPAVRRLVAEPDVRNAKSVALMQRVGFRLGPVVPDLPMPGGGTKPAQLAFLERSDVAPG